MKAFVCITYVNVTVRSWFPFRSFDIPMLCSIGVIYPTGSYKAFNLDLRKQRVKDQVSYLQYCKYAPKDHYYWRPLAQIKEDLQTILKNDDIQELYVHGHPGVLYDLFEGHVPQRIALPQYVNHFIKTLNKADLEALHLTEVPAAHDLSFEDKKAAIKTHSSYPVRYEWGDPFLNAKYARDLYTFVENLQFELLV